MKRKLKSFLMAVCMVFAVAAIFPVTGLAETAKISDDDRSSLEGYLQQMIQQITAMTDEQIDEALTPSSILTAPNKFYISTVESWSNAKKEIGAFKSTENVIVEVNDDSISVSSTAICEKGSANVTLTINRDDMQAESMVFDTSGDASMAVKLEKAALNTVMGLLVVFIMLFFLCGLISLFKHINKIGAKEKKEEPEVIQPVSAIEAEELEIQEELVEDGELVAVIAAAIAASENTSADGFVVRSIRKTNNRKWQRA